MKKKRTHAIHFEEGSPQINEEYYQIVRKKKLLSHFDMIKYSFILFF